MKINRTKLARIAGVILLTTLSGASSLLRADSGTCNGAGITIPFTDVAGNQFFCQIAEAYLSGLTNGTSAVTYSPHAPVPREQMAAFVTRTMDQAINRGGRSGALGQWWTQQYCSSTALTPVGSHPLAVKSDGEFLWVANYIGGTVTRVHASDGKVTETWTGMTHPTDLLIANGRVYVTGGTTPGKLYVIDPDQQAGNASVLATIGNEPHALAFDGEHILTANNVGSVTNYHVPSASQITYTNGLVAPAAILYDGSSFWVTDPGDEKLKQISISGQINQIVDVGSDPFYPTFDGINIWVPSKTSDSIAVVRASTGAVVATLSGNGLDQPYSAAFDGERILVTNHNGNSVSLWSATGLKPLGSFSVGTGSNPQGACSDGINFWIAFSGTDKLARY